MIKKSIIVLFVLFSAYQLNAQVDKTQALAKQYYQNGDYVKAAQMFEELWKKEPNNSYYYSSLYNSLLRLNEYNQAETIVKKQIKKHKTNINYHVDLGYIYSQNNQAEAAEKEFEEAINSMPSEVNSVRSLANKFLSIRQADYAVESYLRGRELLKDKNLFGFELGNIYLQNNKPKEAVATYLKLMDGNPSYQNSVQSVLSNHIDRQEIQDELESQLYTLVQKNSGKNEYPEMLIWLFTHQNDYEQALIQAKALDKRNQEDGGRILQLADNAVQEAQYDAAIDAYLYLQSKGETSRYYQKAKSNQINAQKLKITTTSNYTKEDILSLKNEYNRYLEKYGKNSSTISTIRELANLEANYLYNLKKAIGLLEEILSIPNLNKKTKNEVKLDLGDYYILADDVWEATLFYAQVDKDEKDSPLGEDARYRNARLSFYKGEFEWAQAQLGILKGATTELIANNALDLSIFILDNLGLDSTTATMEMFADAELLHIQNKDESALNLLDSILYMYPGHKLSDDVIYKKANIHFENGNYEKSVELLKGLIMVYGKDLLADNAHFMLGEIYQFHLVDQEKAMNYYKTIITDFSDSVLMVEARKRFRILRGDEI